ncbi:MAG: alpha/beta hydrolase, partial [Microbacterium sp.]
DADMAFMLADFYNGRIGVGSYQDNSTEAFRAYNCMDYPLDTTQADKDAADALIQQKAPTIAPYWDGVDVCESWPYPPTGVRERITADGAAPIVVVGTTNDPATPYAWSQSLAEQLSSGVLITREGEGHTGYNKGNACVDDAVEAYFLDGTVPQDGLTCSS